MDTDPQRPTDDEGTSETVAVGDPDTAWTDPVEDEPARAPEQGSRPAEDHVVRPSGPSWPTVVLGLVAAAVGALVLAAQVADLDVDWSVATPAVVVAAGGVLVALGVLSLVRRRDP